MGALRSNHVRFISAILSRTAVPHTKDELPRTDRIRDVEDRNVSVREIF